MATKTRVDLATSAMREIKKLSVGEEFAAEDQTFVLEKIDQAHAKLDELEIVYWDEEEIPESMMVDYTILVAADIAGRYTSVVEAATYRARRKGAQLEMQRLTSRQKPPVDEEEKFF